jgi:hypothetical protein
VGSARARSECCSPLDGLTAKPDPKHTHTLRTRDTRCTQALGQQPYAVESQLEAAGAGGGPGVASRGAASAMTADLGRVTSTFAVNTLGRLHGMGGTKAWVSAVCHACVCG